MAITFLTRTKVRPMKKKKNSYFSKIQEQYDNKQNAWKTKIKSEPNKFKRFWKEV